MGFFGSGALRYPKRTSDTDFVVKGRQRSLKDEYGELSTEREKASLTCSKMPLAPTGRIWLQYPLATDTGI